MSLNQVSVIDVIEVVENGILQIRQRNDIIEDTTNQVIASTFHRTTFSPGDDISNQPERIRSIANAVWTPEVIAAYKEQINNSLQNLQG